MRKPDRSLSWIDDHTRELINLSDQIWAYAELGLHETRSAKDQEDYLRQNGFDIESGVAGMPTAFVATWGSGRPVIGLLGEFDALPGCSNDTLPERKEIIPEGPGHACGHNLLGVAALGAAIAAKEELIARGLNATVKYYGCPAEENFAGKAYMAKEGYFNDLDACLTWHAAATNTVRGGSSLAVNMVNFHFHGRTAHAAGAPHHGRSALDAVEIMNVGVNYLREHVLDSVRMHYVITNGGRQPNVVPAEATVWYYIRAPRRQDVDEVYARVIKCAEGAAHMTETTLDIEFLAAMNEVLPNEVLSDVLYEALQVVGPPQFTDDDVVFAAEITKTFPAGQRESILRQERLPKEVADKVLNDTILPRPTDRPGGKGSTDVGDVSWVTPTSSLSTACYALGTAGHSWQIAAQSGMGIGHAGMIAATRTMATATVHLIENPSVVEKAKKEYFEVSGGTGYKSGIPTGVNPPLHIHDPNKKRA